MRNKWKVRAFDLPSHEWPKVSAVFTSLPPCVVFKGGPAWSVCLSSPSPARHLPPSLPHTTPQQTTTKRERAEKGKAKDRRGLRSAHFQLLLLLTHDQPHLPSSSCSNGCHPYTHHLMRARASLLLLVLAARKTKMKATHQQADPFVLIDALYCEEESWEAEVAEVELEGAVPECRDGVSFTVCGLVAKQDLFWEDDELLALFSKEEAPHACLASDPFLLSAREEAISWMLKVIAHYSFCPATALLSINNLDRFLASLYFQRDKPWMTQLSAVACLSLAAKVEETHVPLLLDLQVSSSSIAHIKIKISTFDLYV